ncbi:hypothetical protein Rsub_08298 [Raphidocelis subcapitata]|uniref:PNPLA domain-containing protein n=1 Tax=Raphidocelis subcapitata TaxID=307507 RepID=A0A2V0PDM1_9CHLO|nr:hypothetical protein Rsub_08298 [Raphidocelis subcapitata]|eukprot:GBF95267.1 hypothetical protein Rsub_08298 [Raphidocelis subcapitata]
MAVPVTAALAAHRAGSLGLGLSGGGFIIPFMLGVIQMLYVELGVMKYSMPVAGASTGSICASVASGLVPVQQMCDTIARTSNKCRDKGNCFGVLQAVVQAAANELLALDAAEQANRMRNLYVAVTYPSPLGLEPAEVKLISQFSNRSDLIGAIDSSTYIPYWSGPLLTTKYRGADVYDGSMGGNGAGFLPCPPNLNYCVRVSTMPAGVPLNTLLLNLMATPEDRGFTLGIAANTVAGSDVGGILSGVAAARVAVAPETAVAGPGRLAQLTKALMSLTTPGEGDADIWPGRRHPLPVSDYHWMEWMVTPPNDSERKVMFDLGRAEALSWAQEVGFPEAAGKSVAADGGQKQGGAAAATSVSMSG